jgi:glutamate racemase
MKLGVFDSGIGGEAVAAQLKEHFPDAIIHMVNDREHVPYGLRPPSEIIALTKQALTPLLDGSYDIIVIACNTATAVAIETLRSTYPEQLFIGLEPMIKPAVATTHTGVVAVCATPATLKSTRYTNHKETYPAITFFEPDCSDWASLIEAGALEQRHIKSVVTSCLDADADVIVLGCTHYHWIGDNIAAAAAGKAIVLEPSNAIASRVRELLSQ